MLKSLRNRFRLANYKSINDKALKDVRRLYRSQKFQKILPKRLFGGYLQLQMDGNHAHSLISFGSYRCVLLLKLFLGATDNLHVST